MKTIKVTILKNSRTQKLNAIKVIKVIINIIKSII